MFLVVVLQLKSISHKTIETSFKMAYPENVGIKAMEIYIPNQVRASHNTLESTSIGLFHVRRLIEIHSAWTKRFLNSIRAFPPANTLSAWV